MANRMKTGFQNILVRMFIRFRHITRDQGTEQVELLLAAILTWWSVYTYYYALFPWMEDSLSATSSLGQLSAYWPLYWWASVLLAVVFAQIVGTIIDLVILRMIGSFGSLVMWVAIAFILFARAHTSPIWGGFAILALSSLWVFLRLCRDAYWRSKSNRERS